MQSFQHQRNLIGIFAQHRVAANLLMMMMILAGIWALDRINTQFFPNFELDFITINIVWSGATAEDVQTAITRPIEQELRSLDNIRKLTSTSANSVSAITLEYEEGSDMGVALDQVKDAVSLIRNLPSDSETPKISRVIRYDLIASLLISGPENPEELRHLVQGMEHELLERGIAKIEIVGLPEQEIAIQVPGSHLADLGLTLNDIGQRVSGFSQDIPAGSIGRNDATRQLRSLDQRRDELAFAKLPVIADDSGRLLRLGDIAHIERRAQDGEQTISYKGKPAVQLQLQRAESSDSLENARILNEWLQDARPKLPPNVNLVVYDEAWSLIQQRINLLLRNGLSGLVLVVATLFIFLNARVAFWVAAGIPISLMGMLAVLYSIGGSINMISLFAMIMALGVIVDDAIIVGEDAFTHFQTGENPLTAAEGGAQRMLPPVVAASLTTVAAFLPLMLIGGPIGNILFDIPLVMVCVLAASVIECFLVLPGHLRHTFHSLHGQPRGRLREKLEKGFDVLRDVWFRPLVTYAIDYRWTMVSFIMTAMLLAVGLLAGGRLQFTFFPSPDGTVVTATASFASGTPPETVASFLDHLEKTAEETDAHLGGGVVNLTIGHHSVTPGGGGSVQRGDQFGYLMVELTSPDSREVYNRTFIREWQSRIIYPPGIESLNISERRGGPPGRDLEVRLNGEDPKKLKTAALELTSKLKTFDGVSSITDDMPFGREQWIYHLTPQGKALGLTVESVGRQLRAAFDGQLVQIFQDGDDEIEVRLILPDEERYNLAALSDFNLLLPNGRNIAFFNAVSIKTQRGFETLRRANGRLAIQVSADVDSSIANGNIILSELESKFLPELVQRYNLNYSLEGRAADQAETLGDMKRGLIFGLALMYLILAWQFASYGWPLTVMLIIPFGLVGALFGHWFMGIDLTILSLFGFFGLSGIVVNDSIVLVTFYRHLREAGVPVRTALIEASCQRLRAVLLTSLTTIFGLLPLLAETSLQAQFLIPMATSIAFGLMFATIMVLLVIPALLSIYERLMLPKEAWDEPEDKAVIQT